MTNETWLSLDPRGNHQHPTQIGMFPGHLKGVAGRFCILGVWLVKKVW